MRAKSWDAWASLRERFGDPIDASRLPDEERAQAIRERRALRIQRSSDGFGTTNWFISWMTIEPAGDGDRWLQFIDVVFKRPAVVTDEELNALKADDWGGWDQIPALP